MNQPGGLQHWLTGRLNAWQQLLPTLQRLELGRKHTAQEALDAIDNYRLLGRDLSIARRVLPSSRLTRALEHRYARLHAVIHRKSHHWPTRLLTLFRDDIPAIMHDIRGTVAWVSALFVLSALTGWLLINAYPELVSLLAGEDMINGVEQGKLWTRDGMLNAMPAALVSAGLFTNNIAVSLMAACLGVFFGLGTFYIVAMNGLMLGGLFAFTAQHGLGDDLFEFVIAHGVVELSVICVSSAVGVMLGEALIRPTHSTRLESFQYAAARAVRVLLLGALLLVGCGFIEGGISLHSNLPLSARIAIGAGYGLIMVAAYTGRLFGKRTARAKPVQSLPATA